MFRLDTDLKKALSSIKVTTKDFNWAGETFLGRRDETEDLLSLYPKIVSENGEVNKAILETAISSADVEGADKQRLESMLENLNTMEKAYAQFADYISSIFSGLGDSVTDAFQKAYEESGNSLEGIEEAVSSVEVAMSDMIENFTRDAIEMSLLQPFITKMNDSVEMLTDKYKGEIDSAGMKQGITDVLSEFYSNVKKTAPVIMDAYETADELAKKAGFDSAFNKDESAGFGEDIQESAGAQVQRTITEATGTELVGRANAIMLSNEKILQISEDGFTLSMKRLSLLNEIKLNTDNLSIIADNTKKTADAIRGV